jgi:hypothetical protein
MTLACLAKQSFLPFLLAGVGHAFLRYGWRGWAFLASAASSYLLSFLLLDRSYPQWYRYFVYLLPYGHGSGLNLAGAIEILTTQVLLPVAAASILALVYFLAVLKQKSWHRELSFALPAGAALGIGWLGLMNPGGFQNVLVPWHALLAITVGLLLGNVLPSASSRPLVKSGILAVLILQFGALLYLPGEQIPNADDRRAGEDLIRTIQLKTGEVYVPYHPELLLFSGRPTYADWVGLKELKGGFGGDAGSEEWHRLKVQLLTAFRRHRFSLIIVDGPNLPGEPENHYVGRTIEYVSEDTFYPVTGWQIRPAIALVPAD